MRALPRLPVDTDATARRRAEIFRHMDGKGWKPQYGISQEGIDLLGYVEALPRDARRELVAAVAELCKSQGYLSLHDDLRAAVGRIRVPRTTRPAMAKVIPIFRKQRRG